MICLSGRGILAGMMRKHSEAVTALVAGILLTVAGATIRGYGYVAFVGLVIVGVALVNLWVLERRRVRDVNRPS